MGRRPGFASICAPRAQRCVRASSPRPQPRPAGKLMGSRRCAVAANVEPGARPGAEHDAPHPRRPTRSRALMAKPNSGEVTERRWTDGQTVTFGARVRAYGKRHRLTFGTNRQGWNRTRADIALEEILQKVERGTWAPPDRRTPAIRSGRTRPDGHQPFGAFARKVIASKRAHGLDDDTIHGLQWRLGYLLGEFERLELLEMDVARVDGFRDDLAERSRIIRDAAARGNPLMELVTPENGEPYKRHKRALSNGSINEILALLTQILQRAVDYGYIERNAMRVGERKDRFLPTSRPRRTFLEVDEF